MEWVLLTTFYEDGTIGRFIGVRAGPLLLTIVIMSFDVCVSVKLDDRHHVSQIGNST